MNSETILITSEALSSFTLDAFEDNQEQIYIKQVRMCLSTIINTV